MTFFVVNELITAWTAFLMCFLFHPRGFLSLLLTLFLLFVNFSYKSTRTQARMLKKIMILTKRNSLPLRCASFQAENNTSFLYYRETWYSPGKARFSLSLSSSCFNKNKCVLVLQFGPPKKETGDFPFKWANRNARKMCNLLKFSIICFV